MSVAAIDLLQVSPQVVSILLVVVNLLRWLAKRSFLRGAGLSCCIFDHRNHEPEHGHWRGGLLRGIVLYDVNSIFSQGEIRVISNMPTPLE